MKIIAKNVDLSRYFYKVGKKLLKADIVLNNDKYHLDNIELYNKELKFKVLSNKNRVLIRITYLMVKVIDIRLRLSTLKSSVIYGKKNRKVNDNEIITIDQIMRRIEEIKIGNNIALKRKLSLFNFNKDIILNVFKEMIDNNKLLVEINMEKIPSMYRLKFYAHNWRFYIKRDIESCITCDKQFSFKMFKENIEKILDGSRTEVVGFKTAEKFIDVFLNV